MREEQLAPGGLFWASQAGHSVSLCLPTPSLAAPHAQGPTFPLAPYLVLCRPAGHDVMATATWALPPVSPLLVLVTLPLPV